MTFALDPEFAADLAPNAEAMAESTPPPVGDVKIRRATFEAIIASANTAQPTPPDVTTTDFRAVSSDGATVPLRWYAKEGASPGSAALYLHGGGMIVGNFGLFDAPLSRYVSASGVPMLSVDYRVAPEHPHPVPVEDSYAGLRWLSDHADELGVDPARIAVMGDSAGGGLAAAVALLARDRSGPVVARQILLYPMLDDRNTTADPEIVPFAGWSYDDNATGWGALLGNAVGGPEVSAYAAPARATDLSGLPAAYIEVGQLDIFRDEDLEYARRLSLAGVPVEFHLYPGVPHEFDAIAFDSDVAQRARAGLIRVLRSL
jgi:acetyl esterase/lipase